MLVEEEATGERISGIEPPRLLRDARGGTIPPICSTSLRLPFGERDLDRPTVGDDEERAVFSCTTRRHFCTLVGGSDGVMIGYGEQASEEPESRPNCGIREV